jgi:hypothetical protein
MRTNEKILLSNEGPLPRVISKLCQESLNVQQFGFSSLALDGQNSQFAIVIAYSYPVELFTTVLLVVISLGLGVGLLIYGIRGTRESQARDGRTYKRGRL